VELHNGHISVFSAGEGLGCTFTLELPLYRETPASSKDTFAEHGLQIRIPQRSDHFASRHNVSPNPVVTPQRRSKDRGSVTGPASSTPGRPFRMLVVDDSALNRKMLCRYVGPRCEVLLEAADGEQALAKYREAAESGKPLDVVLMDNNMPRKSGPQAAKEMRALGYKGYIVGITGNAVAADMEEYLKSGADKVLSKPIDVIALESVLSGEETYFCSRPCSQSANMALVLCQSRARSSNKYAEGEVCGLSPVSAGSVSLVFRLCRETWRTS